MRLPDTTHRTRRIALAIVLVAQTLFFFAFAQLPPTVLSDNFRYEVPAWEMSQGHGFAMPYEEAPDPVIHHWVCDRHAEACANGTYPVAIYPPGYSVFIAPFYEVFGRKLWPVIVAQLGLLLLMFVLLERLASKYLDGVGYWFAMGVSALYPFLARQASFIMSDHLHNFLIFAALAVWLLDKPGVRRGVLFGVLIATATLTRPYSLFVVPILFLWRPAWRALESTRREWVAAILAAGAPFVLWTARNFYWFGKIIPFSTTGLGATFYFVKLEAELGLPYDQAKDALYNEKLNQFGDMALFDANQRLGQEGLGWIMDHKLKATGVILSHIPKVWVSLGTAGTGLGPSTLVMATVLGGLFLLGLAGIVLKRKDARWHPLIVTIIVYWAFILPGAEARRTLPLRLPMLLLAAFAVQHVVAARAAKRAKAKAPAADSAPA